MKNEVRIELPKKYRVGLEMVMDIDDADTMDVCKELALNVSSKIGYEIEDKGLFDREFLSKRKVFISPNLIYSIAETKMNAINTLCLTSLLPFKAFIEKENDA